MSRVMDWVQSFFGGGHVVEHAKEYEMVDIEPQEFETVNVDGSFESSPKKTSTQQKGGYWEEFLEIWKVALPLIFTLTLEFLPASLSVAFVGKYAGSTYVDASSYASRLANIVGVSIGIGLLGALETLSSQSHGANNTKAIGFYIQQSFFILALLMLPITYILFSAEQILLAMAQPPEVSKLAGEFSVWMAPSVALTFVYEIMRRSMQAIGILTPFTIAALVGLILQTVATWYVLSQTQIGFLGAAYARLFGQVGMVFTVFLYTFVTGVHHQFWSGWNLAAAHPSGWKYYWEIGVPGIFQLGFEWWAFEIQVILCGWLSDAQASIAAYSIINMLTITTFMFYYGPATAVSIRCGTHLGAADGQAAKRTYLIGVALNTVLGLLGALCLQLFWKELALLFVDDALDHQVLELIGEVVYVASIYQVFDSVNALYSGVFRATGLQSVAAVIVFVAFWVVGLPSAYLLTFKAEMDPPLAGILLGGNALGMLFAVLADVPYVHFRFDWDELAFTISEERKQDAEK